MTDPSQRLQDALNALEAAFSPLSERLLNTAEGRIGAAQFLEVERIANS